MTAEANDKSVPAPLRRALARGDTRLRGMAAVEAKKEAIDKLPTPGERKRIRERAGLTLQDIGTLCGSSREAVWRWENGNRYPRIEYLVTYAEVLDRLRRGQG